MNAHQERYNVVTERLRILHYMDAQFPAGRVNFTSVGRHFNISRETARRIYYQRNDIEPRPRGRPRLTPVAPAPVARAPFTAEEGDLGVNVALLFSPRHPTTIEAYLDNATQTLDISMHVISSRTLIDAIIRAARRRVVVRIFTDLQQAQTFPGGYRELIATNQIQINYWDTLYEDMNENYTIVDGEIVLIGSPSWSVEAFDGRNFEACAIIRGHASANSATEHFRANWVEGQYLFASDLRYGAGAGGYGSS